VPAGDGLVRVGIGCHVLRLSKKDPRAGSNGGGGDSLAITPAARNDRPAVNAGRGFVVMPVLIEPVGLETARMLYRSPIAPGRARDWSHVAASPRPSSRDACSRLDTTIRLGSCRAPLPLTTLERPARRPSFRRDERPQSVCGRPEERRSERGRAPWRRRSDCVERVPERSAGGASASPKCRFRASRTRDPEGPSRRRAR
jgi:hypothetical protein